LIFFFYKVNSIFYKNYLFTNIFNQSPNLYILNFFFLKKYFFFLKKIIFFQESFFTQNFIKSLIFWKIKSLRFLVKPSYTLGNVKYFKFNTHYFKSIPILKFTFLKFVFNLFIFFLFFLLLHIFIKFTNSFMFIYNFILVSPHFLLLPFYNQRLLRVYHF